MAKPDKPKGNKVMVVRGRSAGSNTKSTKRVAVEACKCGACGQIANASPDTTHHGCIGVGNDHPLARLVKSRTMDLTFPKGTWAKYVKPEQTVEEPKVETAETIANVEPPPVESPANDATEEAPLAATG